MAGERMTSTEIWLRLVHTGSLCGDVMLEAAARLQKQEHLNVLVARNAGLTAKQVNASLHSMRASWNVALCGLSSRDIIY